MTTSNPAAGLPEVLAQAVVRARDGRSVLHRSSRPTEPAKVFLADPERLLRAVALLEDGGLVVEGVDRVSVYFRGTAGSVQAVFGVALVHADAPGAITGAPQWRRAGAAGDTVFDVDPGTALGGALHRVVLLPPAAPAATNFVEMFATGRQMSTKDFMIGEAPFTLKEDLPAGRSPTVATDDATALAMTRKATTTWDQSPSRDKIRTLVDANRTAGKKAVQTVIAEQAFHPQTKNGFQELRSAPDTHRSALAVEIENASPSPVVASGRYSDATTESWARRFDVDGDIATAWVLYHEAHEALDSAVRAGRPAAGPDNWFERGYTAVHAAVERVIDLTSDLPDPVTAGPVEWDAAARQRLTLTLDTIVAHLAGGRPGPAAKLWGQLVEPLGKLAAFRRWFIGRLNEYRRLRDLALADARRHATMVSYAFLAVALDRPTVELRNTLRAKDYTWAADPPGSDAVRTVVSCSLGRSATNGLGAPGVEIQRVSRLADLSGVADRVLYVLAVGNRSSRPELNVPDTQCTLAGTPNVLIVGGCRPDAAGRVWVRNEETHGYAATVTVDGTDRPFTVPDVCAPTEGATDGALLFPDTPEHPERDEVLRWWRGNGCSLSTPLVAAVCSLVWAVYPDLDAAQVKAAVLAGTLPLGGGPFHVPAARGSDRFGPVPPTSPGDPGPGRVVLALALAKAGPKLAPVLQDDPAGLATAASTGSTS